MGNGWLKFAILGSTYARALQNAARRAGQAAPDAAYAGIAAQPLAKLKPGLSTMAREPGALTPTPQQQDMQKMLARVPWAGGDHGGTAHAEPTLNAMLRRRGLDYNTPAGQPSTQDLIHRADTAQKKQAPETGRQDTEVPRKVPYKGPGPSPFNLMDHDVHTPGALPLPAANTRIGPAPAPVQGQPQAPLGTRMPAAPPQASGERTQVMHGQWAPPWQRAQAAGRPIPRAPLPGANNATAVLHKVAGALPLAAGIGIPLAVGGGILATKPGIRADLADRFGNPGDIHQKDNAQAIPEEVQGQATRAHQALIERGINPAGLRIAVDAPSGAGKTVLSKALASQMGLRHHGLDWRPNLRLHQLMGGGDIEKTPYAPHAGEILEHQQLLRSYDPELFDVAIHIHKDPAAIRQQVLKRGRGARTHDLLDYEKSIGVGRKAFETLGGEAIDLGGGVMMKVRPQEGWGNQLDQQLAAQGIDPSGLSRHQKLLSLHSGKREEHGAGWTPYMKNPFTGGETAALAASVPLGVMAARALARH